MSSSVTTDERVPAVDFDDDAISVTLRDGRVISVPLAWYPRLLSATAPQRRIGELQEAVMAFTGQISTKT